MKMRGLLLALLSVGFTHVYADDVVYQNLTGQNILDSVITASFPNSFEFGDQITLGGPAGSRLITGGLLKVDTFDNGTVHGNHNFDITMRFRNLDTVNNIPGTVFYQAVDQVRNLAPGFYNLTLPSVPNVLVPNTFVVTFQFSRVSGNDGDNGVEFGGTPTVGTSDPSFYWVNTGGWTKNGWPIANSANLGIQLNAVNAVPEPATVLLVTACVAGIVRRRKLGR